MRKIVALLTLTVSTGVLAKLPPPSPEAKAKSTEAAARTAWSAKADAYKLCQSQDKVAAQYFASAKAAGKPTKPPVSTPSCADPGPFVELRPIEASGAHSPSETASSPPSTKEPESNKAK